MSKKISIVFPILNEEENLLVLYEQVKDACLVAGVDYEMICVDDGSTDGSMDVIKGLRAKDLNVKYVSFSRNFGHQNAFFAGMSYAKGDAVITMDADLQHPPSLIPKMVETWQKGAEVVYTTKNDANLDPVKNIIVKTAYWFISKISGLKLEFGQSDFRLIDRKALDVILKMPEYHKFLRGQVSWIGFKQESLSYNVAERYAGRAKYSYKSLYNLALDGIFAFGRYPLHLIMLFSLLILFISTLYIFVVAVIWFLKVFKVADIPVPFGWTDLIVAVFFLGSVQLIAIGILGEYLGRIYDQTKGRPVFIIREQSE